MMMVARLTFLVIVMVTQVCGLFVFERHQFTAETN